MSTTAPAAAGVWGRARGGPPAHVLASLLLVLAAALAGGCSVFGTNVDPVRTYRLDGALTELPPVAGEPCCLLEIRSPLPAPGFATARMVYQRNEFQNEAFAYAAWVDTLPSMVRAALIEAFDQSSRFGSVVAAPSPEQADYRLESSGLYVIQRFDGRDSEVEVSMRVRLVGVADRELRGARRFSVVKPTPTADPEGGVVAANEALTALLAELMAYVASLVGDA